MQFNLKKVLSIAAIQCICGFISIQAFGQENESVKLPHYDVIEEAAEFPGGKDSLMRFIKENMKYPERAKKEGIEGKCYLQFVIEKDGSVSNIQVKKGVEDCPECDAEAVRILKSMPHWKPGKSQGEDAISVYSLPISFKL